MGVIREYGIAGELYLLLMAALLSGLGRPSISERRRFEYALPLSSSCRATSETASALSSRVSPCSRADTALLGMNLSLYTGVLHT